MPKMGVSAHANQSKAHTATEQWQSFEIRMRHRRAERCLLRAEAALDAGLEAEARAAVDEARSLRPETPSFDELAAAARGRRAAAAANARSRQARLAALAAAAGLILLLGIGWAIFEPRETADVETVVSAPEPAPPPPLAQATTGIETPKISEPQPPSAKAEGSLPPDTTSAAEGATAAAPRRPAPPPIVRERTTDRRVAAPLPSVQAEPPSPAVRSDPPPTTTESIQRPPVDASLSAGTLGAPATASMKAPPLPPAAVPKPKAASPPPVSQEPAVRDVLARFEAAYSSLSASAARQVWPSVDARALSRAFEGLDSQRVSLGTCRVTVEASAAHAECSGSATWTPKIGGGRRTEARRWEFDLARDNGAWLIVQARAR